MRFHNCLPGTGYGSRSRKTASKRKYSQENVFYFWWLLFNGADGTTSLYFGLCPFGWFYPLVCFRVVIRSSNSALSESLAPLIKFTRNQFTKSSRTKESRSLQPELNKSMFQTVHPLFGSPTRVGHLCLQRDLTKQGIHRMGNKCNFPDGSSRVFLSTGVSGNRNLPNRLKNADGFSSMSGEFLVWQFLPLIRSFVVIVFYSPSQYIQLSMCMWTYRPVIGPGDRSVPDKFSFNGRAWLILLLQISINPAVVCGAGHNQKTRITVINNFEFHLLKEIVQHFLAVYQ